MKKLLLASAALCALTARAERLGPDEALACFLSEQPRMARSISGTDAADYTLSYTGHDDALYAFNGKSGGFVVLAADEEIGGHLLGYGDSSIDPGNMPPALEWMLEVMSRSRLSRPVMLPAHADIPYMVTTKWDQDAPFNNDCPMLNGSRTYTGCMATAIAQVMAHKNNRMQGSGSFSYSWQTGRKDLTFNYGNNPFDYANMIDDYSGGAGTAAQRNAVANLMYGVGVACEMEYMAQGSGAADIPSGAGMIRNLGCDRGMQVLNRDFYTEEEWDAIIYDQLASGRPMVYTGVSASGGHAFVCDGYERRGDANYYHINWGWGGMSDAYFELAHLNPEALGIGGGDDTNGFNAMQSAFIGIKPAQAGSQLDIVFWQYGTLSTAKSEYKRKNRVPFKFTGNQTYGGGAVMSGTLENVNAVIGFKIINKADNSESYVELSDEMTLEPGSGLTSLPVPGALLPSENGTYVVKMAFKVDGKWYSPREELACRGDLEMTIDGDNISFSLVDKGERLRVSFIVMPKEIAKDRATRLEVEFVAGAGSVDTEITPCLVTSSGSIRASMASKALKLAKDESATLSWNEEFAKSVRNGSYYLVLINGSGEVVSDLMRVEVVDTSAIETVVASGSDTPVEFFTIDGRRLNAAPAPGTMVIRRQGDKVEKVLY